MGRNPLFSDRVAVIATMHKKEQVIAPLLEQIGIKTRVIDNFDTDSFGTFTREISRPGNQIETVRMKAEKALMLTGGNLAIASEGTFGPHPDLPYISSNREIVILLDRINNLEIVGQAVSIETNFSHRTIQSLEEAYEFALKVGFPQHGLIVMIDSDSQNQDGIFKGITTEAHLMEAVTLALKRSSNGKVHIETDMRALYNPTRMKNIEKATRDLIKKINQICPLCSHPGFDVVEQQRGLPCALCHLPTATIRAAIYRCKKCGFQQEILFPTGLEKADPAQCMYCNP